MSILFFEKQQRLRIETQTFQELWESEITVQRWVSGLDHSNSGAGQRSSDNSYRMRCTSVVCQNKGVFEIFLTANLVG